LMLPSVTRSIDPGLRSRVKSAENRSRTAPRTLRVPEALAEPRRARTRGLGLARLARLPDRIGRVRPAPVHGFRRALRRVAHGLPLELGMDLGAEHDAEARQIQPEQQHDDTAERTVGFAVAARVADVQREERAADDPACGGDPRAPRDPA